MGCEPFVSHPDRRHPGDGCGVQSCSWTLGQSHDSDNQEIDTRQKGVANMPAITPDLRERARGCLLGAAIGDAFGMALEGAPRRPVTDQVRELRRGRLPEGHFTAHTRAMLVIAESLLEPEPLSAEEMVARITAPPSRPARRRGLLGHLIGGRPQPRPAEKGPDANPFPDAAALARCMPVALANLDNHFACLAQAREISRTAYSHPDCVAGAAFAASVLWHLVQGLAPRQAVQQSLQACSDLPPVLEETIRWASTRMRDKLTNGAQVREIVEATVWGLLTTASFAEAITRVSNLGGKAAIAGTVIGAWAGAAYRHSGIPADWRARAHGSLSSRDGRVWREKDLVELAERLVLC